MRKFITNPEWRILNKNLKTCHSEARFIGRGICFFLTAAQQIPTCTTTQESRLEDSAIIVP
jgi:hypothetical protein